MTVRAPHSGYDVRANTATGQVVVDGRELRLGLTPQAVAHAWRWRPAGHGHAVSGYIVVLRIEVSAATDSIQDEVV